MTLNLYRRHVAHCPGGRAHQERTYEADEHRRSWKSCWCPIYASGTLGGQFRRKNTERTEWAEAKALAAAWELAQSWDGPAPASAALPAPPDTAPEAKTGRITIADAVKAF